MAANNNNKTGSIPSHLLSLSLRHSISEMFATQRALLQPSMATSRVSLYKPTENGEKSGSERGRTATLPQDSQESQQLLLHTQPKNTTKKQHSELGWRLTVSFFPGTKGLLSNRGDVQNIGWKTVLKVQQMKCWPGLDSGVHSIMAQKKHAKVRFYFVSRSQ